MSPALAGGFLTTAPPGKPLNNIFQNSFLCKFLISESPNESCERYESRRVYIYIHLYIDIDTYKYIHKYVYSYL